MIKSFTRCLFIVYFLLPLSVYCGCSKNTKYNNVLYETKKVKNKEQRKRVLILTNSNGGGHISAANAIKDSIENKYDVRIVDILKDRVYGEGIFFKTFSEKELWTPMKFFMALKPFVSEWYYYANDDEIQNDIIDYKPDLIISVFPLLNDRYFDIANRISKPFAIMPTDFNLYDFDHYSVPKLNEKKYEEYNKKLFTYFTTFKFKTDNHVYKQQGILNNIRYIDYPVRRDFLQTVEEWRKNDISLNEKIEEIKKYYKISKEDKSILISIGAQSFNSDTIIQYISIIDRNIGKIVPNDNKLFLFIACGKNQQLQKEVRKYKKTSQKLILIPLRWMNGADMAKYMIMTDFSIIKPGGSATAELLALNNKKALFKSDTEISMSWEKENLKLVEMLNYGKKLNHLSILANVDEEDLITKINALFEEIKQPTQNKNWKRNTFYSDIGKAVDEIIGNVDK